MPAHASARAEATCDRVVIGTWETRRSRIPVRVVIHSSLVSRRLASGKLSSAAGGMHLPQPVMAACVMAGSYSHAPATHAARHSASTGIQVPPATHVRQVRRDTHVFHYFSSRFCEGSSICINRRVDRSLFAP